MRAVHTGTEGESVDQKGASRLHCPLGHSAPTSNGGAKLTATGNTHVKIAYSATTGTKLRL